MKKNEKQVVFKISHLRNDVTAFSKLFTVINIIPKNILIFWIITV